MRCINKKRMYLVVCGIIAAAILIYAYFTQTISTVSCGRDSLCIREIDIKQDNCIPSSTLMEGRDGIWLMVNITREGDRCVRTETVVISEQPENEYLQNHSIKCEFNLTQIGNLSATSCPGTIYDFVTPSPQGGADSGSAAAAPYDPFPHCGFYDYDCKESISSNVQNCIMSEMTDVDMKWEPNGYWTGLIRMERVDDTCQLYLEVLNAVNLPPDVPSTLVGSSMTCNISLSELPVEYVPESACDGDLYPYLYQIST